MSEPAVPRYSLTYRHRSTVKTFRWYAEPTATLADVEAMAQQLLQEGMVEITVHTLSAALL